MSSVRYSGKSQVIAERGLEEGEGKVVQHG